MIPLPITQNIITIKEVTATIDDDIALANEELAIKFRPIGRADVEFFSPDAVGKQSNKFTIKKKKRVAM